MAASGEARLKKSGSKIKVSTTDSTDSGREIALKTVSQTLSMDFFWRQEQLYRSASEPNRWSRAIGIQAVQGFFMPVLFAMAYSPAEPSRYSTSCTTRQTRIAGGRKEATTVKGSW